MTTIAGRARIVLRWSAGLVAAACIALIIAALLTPVPSFDAVRDGTRGSDAMLLDRNGAPLQRLRLDKSRRVLDWTALDDISPTLSRAVVAAEDRRFWSHPGFDPLAIGSAARDAIVHERPRGASTITMQVAALLDRDAGRGGSRTLAQKLLQLRRALALELHWSKREILEVYLNRVTFRSELVGVRAASLGLFRQGPGALDEAQSAVLAALIRAPAGAPAVVARRACALARGLVTQAQVEATAHDDATCERAEWVASVLPPRPLTIFGEADAPHLARRLLHTPGEAVTSTLDAGLQRFAADVLRNRLAELAEQNVEDGAVVVLDNATGEVLAYIGSSGDLSSARDVDGVTALRQPGSTLKPFLYAMAIEARWLTAASVLDDAPVALPTPSGLYAPQNYERDFKGAVSVRTALASSLNVPAVRTLVLVGVDRFQARLRALGLDSLTQEAEHYGYGLALGDGEVDLLSLTNAYRVLANGGVWSPVRLQPAARSATDQPESRRVIGVDAAYIVADILSDPAARAPTFGLASPLSTRSWAAVKTGTSKAMRDNWAIGFTDRYTVGVWVGNASGAPMWDVSGVTGAAPVWQAIVEHLHADRPSRPPAPPAGVMQQRVAFVPAIEPARMEVFVNGTAQAHVTLPAAARVERPRLLLPADRTVIAPDPDIPASRQRLQLTSSAGAGTCLRLDGAAAAPCGTTEAAVSLPAPGMHQVTLHDPTGRELDRIRFDVKPLPARRTASTRTNLEGDREQINTATR